MRRALALLTLGAVLGVAIYIPLVRSSRNRDTALGQLRDRVIPMENITLPPSDSEQTQLYKRYGPTKRSQEYEEWIVRDFFKDKRGGVFVDIGAADYREGSNTFVLETELDWSGIAVDAQDSYRANWERYRPRTRFAAMFVSDRTNDNARLFLSKAGGFVASSRREFTEGFGTIAGSVDVPTITMNDLLDAAKVSTFDFLSLDIELAEPLSLAGFDIQRFAPTLVCVEAHTQVRQQILDYFAANHYVVVGKYLRVDPLNIWFMPDGASVEPFSLERAIAQ